MSTSRLGPRLAVAAVVAVAVALAIIFWPKDAAPPAPPAARTPVTPAQSAEEKEAIDKLKDYILDLQVMNILSDECSLLQVVYEKEGRAWTQEDIEKAQAKVEELIKHQKGIEQRLRQLGKYTNVEWHGENVAEYARRHQERLDKKKKAAEEQKQFWEDEKKKRMKP